jgi:urease accessory protein
MLMVSIIKGLSRERLKSGLGIASRVRVVQLIAALGVGSLFSNPAAAHVGTGLPGGFTSGFMHPFSGIDHLLAMVSVGLWGAFLGRPLIYALPVVFPAMMVAGAIMGMAGVPLPPVEVGIALSVLVLGGCIALAVRAPIWAACLIVALFAVFHGYAHGKELPSAADPISYSAGFVLATGLLHVAGICLGLLNERPYGVVATRSFGGVIAVMGAWFLYRSIVV